jgi:hypothetical protein
MTVRAPLSEVLTTHITGPSVGTTQFIVAEGSVEGYLTVNDAISLLGTKGDKGDQGNPGYWGSVGYTGSTGTQGVIGFTGSTGTQGIQGIPGFTGSTGTRGVAGYWGSVGYTGSTGTQGRAGFTGSTGTQGVPGFVGSRGADGVVGVANTSTNISGGLPGYIPIQRASSSTAFISTGSVGSLLQFQIGNTATWVNTSTLIVGYATNSDKEFITSLTSLEVTPTRYLTMASGVSNYYGAGASSDLTYHTNNKVLSSPKLTVTSSTNATSTSTGALQVAGGVGIGGNLYVGGEIVAQKLTIQYTTVTTISVVTDDVTTINNTTQASSTTTGALIVAGGVGIGKNLYVGGSLTVTGNINATITGTITTAINLANGNIGRMPYQTGIGATAFIGAGTTGSILVSNGATVIGPSFKTTSSILVGYASNLLSGGAGYLPYQSGSDTTSFLAPGADGSVLRLNGTTLEWGQPSGGVSNTATNIAGGTAGQVPYQTSPGITSFYGPGTSGQILISQGASAPIYTNGSSITVGTANNLAGGSKGLIPIQSASGSTAFINTGTYGQVLQWQNNTTATWVDLGNIGVGTAAIATNLEGGGAGRILYQFGVNQTGFVNTGTSGYILVANGYSTPTWQNTLILTGTTNATSTNTGALQVVGGVGIGKNLWVGGDITVNGTINATITGVSSTATNIAGGTAGQVPYQISPGRTSFYGPGTSGYLLQSNGTSAPSYIDPTTLTIGTASQADNLTGGQKGQIPIQLGSNSTGFISTGTVGYVLQMKAGNTAGWADAGSLTLTTAEASNAIYYPTFVNSNNTSPTSESFYTTSTFTINPGAKEIYVNGTGRFTTPNSGTTGAVVLRSNATNAASMYIQWVNNASSAEYANIGVTVANTMTFSTGGTERMRITSNGGIAFNGATNYGSSGQILQSNGDTAPTWTTLTTLSAGGSAQVDTIRTATNQTHYLTFVNSNNSVPNSESVYTTSSFVINPNTGSVGIGTTSVLGNSLLNVDQGIVARSSTSGVNPYIQTYNGNAGADLKIWRMGGGTSGQFTIETVIDSYGSSTERINIDSSGNFKVSSGAIIPLSGNSSSAGIQFPSNPGGGAGDAAWIRWYARSGEDCTLELGTSNDAADHISLMPSGNVGIGTTTPATKLDVAGRGRFLQDAAATTGAIILRQSSGDSEGAFIQWVDNANTTEKGWLTVDTSNLMKFATVSTERMRIDASGNVGMSRALYVGSVSGTQGVAGEIRATNEITAYYSSDERLKENITTIENALSKVRSLTGVMFDWKDSVIDERGGEDGYFVRRHDTGIIAQEVEKVLPEVVATRDDGFMAVKYEKLAGLIIQSIKELADEVDELKKRIR